MGSILIDEAEVAVRIEVPSKVFLIGEYAVLHGAPAVVAACGPRFEARLAESFGVHRESPAGRWLGARPLEFRDPHEGRGGFGASSAQFAAAFFAYPEAALPSWQSAWLSYRSLHSDRALKPSGADLAVQWVGGIQRFSITSDGRAEMSAVGHHVDLSGISVFSAAHQPGRKIVTHEHLESAAFKKENDLRDVIQSSLEALERESPKEFAQTLTRYAQILSAMGLEHEAARADREAFLSLPGVLGAKGCGAMLADALVIARDMDDPESWDRIESLARDRDLRLVCKELKLERGLTWTLDA